MKCGCTPLTNMRRGVIIQLQDRQLECLSDVDALRRFEMRCCAESYNGCMFTKTRIGLNRKKTFKKLCFMQGFFYGDVKMDLLLQRALEFERLTHYKYRYTLGRKGKLFSFVIDFQRSDFHHIIGLKKLKDLECVDSAREKVFNRILNGEITHEIIKKSAFYHQMEKRFYAFENFVKIFSDENTTYKYTQDMSRSRINADYLLINDSFEELLYLFICKRTKGDTYCCKSFFPFEEFKYELKQTKLTVLKVEQINADTGAQSLVFKNKNYKE